MPGEFIAIAEDTGLILPIGDWVIREACRQARLWQLQGLPFLRVAVNVSPVQFRQPNFVDGVRKALATNSLDAAYLEIELTEATLMTNADESVAMPEQLSRLGVVVAMDDFGTGYSSMSYLQRLPHPVRLDARTPRPATRPAARAARDSQRPDGNPAGTARVGARLYRAVVETRFGFTQG